MMYLTNKQYKYYLPKQESMKRRLKANKAKLERLRKAIFKDEGILMKFDVAKVETHAGYLLDVNKFSTMYGTDVHMRALSDRNQRYAEIYQNAVNKTTWGAHLKIFGGDEIYLGNEWEDMDELIEICKNWVALGKTPLTGTWA